MNKTSEEALPKPTQEPHAAFRRDLAEVINRHSKENGSDTPDFILADYLARCLAAYDDLMYARRRWYGKTDLNCPAPVSNP